MDNLTIAICNFNTTKLTNDAIQSIEKHLSIPHNFTILDNSNISKFELSCNLSNVDIIDNTKGQCINFEDILKQAPYKLMRHNMNNYGSLKHAYSIHWLIGTCQTKNMLLFDSDIILNKDIDFIDEQYITIADIEEHGKPNSRQNNIKYIGKTRFLPFIQYFNVDLIKQHNIKYFDYTRMHGVLAPNLGNHYDTGASLYADVIKLKLPYKQIKYNDYIFHLDHGSWKK